MWCSAVTNTYVTPPASLLEPLSESGGAAQLTSLGQACFSVHGGAAQGSELNAVSSIEALKQQPSLLQRRQCPTTFPS